MSKFVYRPIVNVMLTRSRFTKVAMVSETNAQRTETAPPFAVTAIQQENNEMEDPLQTVIIDTV
jgi:hypothetical protein